MFSNYYNKYCCECKSKFIDQNIIRHVGSRTQALISSLTGHPTSVEALFCEYNSTAGNNLRMHENKIPRAEPLDLANYSLLKSFCFPNFRLVSIEIFNHTRRSLQQAEYLQQLNKQKRTDMSA